MDYCVFLASGLALVLYLNTLDADFAYDDSRAIQKNQDLTPDTPIINIFYDDFWGTPLTHSGSHKSYRPLCVLSFRLNYYLGGLNPWGYHLGNVILHALVTALFTYCARLFLHHTIPTAVAGLLFAAHPVHTEAVAGVVGRADVGACFFFLLAFLCYIKYVHYRSSGSDKNEIDTGWKKLLFVLGTAIFTTASMLTKEQGVMVIAVCASYDLFVYHKVKVTDIFFFKLNLYKKEKVLEGLLSLTCIGLFLIAFRFYFMGFKPPEFAPSDNPASDSESIVTRTLTYFLLPVLNFWILLCPRVLSFDWSMDAIPLVETVFDHRNIFSLLFYGVLAYCCYLLLNYIQNVKLKYTKTHLNGNGFSHHHPHENNHKNSVKYNFKISRQHSRRGSNSSTESDDHIDYSKNYKLFNSQDILIISIAIMVFPFILATNIFFYVGFVIAERILYIPSMGFSLLVAQGVWSLYKKFIVDSSKQKIIGVSFIVLLSLLSAKTVIRNRVWLTEENLYHSGISVNPAKAWGNYANVLNSQGKTSEAEQAYRNALKHRGNMADTHYNLGILLQEQKRYQEAVDSYQRAIQYRPKLSMAHLNLAILFSQLGRQKEAEKIYKHCADLDTSGLKDPRLHENTKISALYNLGRMYSEQDRNQEAIDVYKEALRRRPSYYAPQSIYNMLGEVYMKLGQLEVAENWYNEALKSKPDHIPAHLTMAKLYQKKNQLLKAEEWFQKAKKIDPNDFLVDQHYGQFLGETGRLQESADMYKNAIRRKPDDFEMNFNAANIFRQVQDNAAAEQAYRKAAQLKPNVATAHMNLGAMLHFNGKLLEAEKSYLEALKLKPDDVTTQQNLQKLRNLIQSQQVNGGGGGV